MSLQEVTEFFDRYRAAFNQLDGDAVADLWHVPSGITDSHDGAARLTWWHEDAPMRANHRALCDLYRDNHFDHTDFVIEQHASLGPNHATARVAWSLTRRDASTLQNFHTHYQLVRTSQGVRVLMCTAFDEDIAAMKQTAGWTQATVDAKLAADRS